LNIFAHRITVSIPVALFLIFGAITAHAAPLAGYDSGRVPTGSPAPLPTAFAAKSDRYDWSAVFDAGSTVAVSDASYIAMTPRLWRIVKEINAVVNARTRDDVGKRLDCVGYVKRKRDALIAAGIPAEALSAAVVVTPGRVSHTLLLLSTEAGDVVLDNLEYDVVKWDRTDYVWVEREIAGPARDGSTRWAWINRPATGATVRVMSQ
jgi:predicted transglutaminase-like cysteine proteinase